MQVPAGRFWCCKFRASSVSGRTTQKVCPNPDSFGRFIYVCSESEWFFKSTYTGAVFRNVLRGYLLEDWKLQGKKDRSWPGGRRRPAGNESERQRVDGGRGDRRGQQVSPAAMVLLSHVTRLLWSPD